MKSVTVVLLIVLTLTAPLFAQQPKVFKKVDKLNQKCNSGDKKACQELIDIAKTDEYETVRRYAVGYITDQMVLAEIARNDPSYTVSTAAFEKITEDSILIKFLADPKDSKFGQEATRRIKSQSCLITIAKSNTFYSIGAIERLTDEHILAEIARTDKSESIRLTAVLNPNLINREVLDEISRNDSDQYVRAAAFLKPYVPEQDLLRQICDRYDSDRRSAAIKKLANKLNLDQDTLAFWAKQAPLFKLQEMALNKLTDQVLIADVYDNNNDNFIRTQAIQKLTNEQKLIEIIKTTKDKWLRLEALGNPNLVNEIFLVSIAKNDTNLIMRTRAVSRLTDINKLLTLAQDRRAPEEVRLTAVKGMIKKRGQTKTHDPIIATSLFECGLAALNHTKFDLYKDIFSTLKQLNPEKARQMRQSAPKGSIKGSLVAKKDQTPLANYSVFLAEVINGDECVLYSDLVTHTDIIGKFVITNVPIGKYTIVFSEKVETTSFFTLNIKDISYPVSMEWGEFQSGALLKGTRRLFSKELGGSINFIIQDRSLWEFSIKSGESVVQNLEVY